MGSGGPLSPRIVLLSVLCASCGSAPTGASSGASLVNEPAAPGPRVAGPNNRLGNATAIKPSAVLIGDPTSLADRWLVVAARSNVAGSDSPAIGALANHPELEVQLMRVPSSAFRGLAPCEELVVAGAFIGRDEASFLMRKLATIDVTAELLFTGPYVGRRPQLEAWCEASRTEVSADCGDTRFVETVGGQSWLLLGLDAESTRSLVQSAGAPEAQSDGSWVAALPAQTAGLITVGDIWEGWSPTGPSGACKVTGLSALTRSVPSGEPCGGPVVVASVQCPNGTTFANRPGAKPPTAWERKGAPKAGPLAAAMVAVTQSDAYRGARDAVQRVADSRRGKVDEDFDVDVIRNAESSAMLVVATLSTGSSGQGCTAEGESRTVVGIVGGKGETLTAFQDIGMGVIDGVIDLEGDGKPELFDRTWPSVRTVRGSDGAPRCAFEVPQCVNPC